MSVATMRRPVALPKPVALPAPGVRAIYMMAKPPPDALARIAALARNDAGRALDLRHVTLLPFGFVEARPAGFVEELCDRMAGFIAYACHVRFDRIAERSAVTLRATRPQRGVKALQRQIMRHLAVRDFPFFGNAPDPHLTIHYARDGRGAEAMEPIMWRIDDILLIESIQGEARHVVRGRWPLQVPML